MVQDNLNTHDASAFYENLPTDEALALAKRFDFYYTPKSASWLNMIEIEFSTLSRQCLNRRIPTIEKLEHEILALVAERTEQKIKIDRCLIAVMQPLTAKPGKQLGWAALSTNIARWSGANFALIGMSF